jgi:hypothetical protein
MLADENVGLGTKTDYVQVILGAKIPKDEGSIGYRGGRMRDTLNRRDG